MNLPPSKTPEPQAVPRERGHSHESFPHIRSADDALSALSAARDRYELSSGKPPPPSRRIRLIPPILAAAVIGAAIFLWQEPIYRCSCTLQLQGDPAQTQIDRTRKELFDQAWKSEGLWNQKSNLELHWFVSSPAEGMLEVGTLTNNRKAGLEFASVTTEAFLSRIDQINQHARETPSNAEAILAQPLEKMNQELSTADVRTDKARSAVPTLDPTETRKELEAHWEAKGAEFMRLRGEIAEAESSLQALRSSVAPARGSVSDTVRSAALEWNKALQQDLSELNVNLSEIKLQLLNVWQASSGPLERLALAVENLLSLQATSAPLLSTSSTNNPADWKPAAKAFGSLVAGFAKSWNFEFKNLSRTTPDPLVAGVLDGALQIRRYLNDFLFGAGKRLGTLREQVRTTRENQADDAGSHVFQSKLIRFFGAVEAAFHRFEFSAADLDTPQNFRLDAAMASARGLRRRSRDRIRGIDKQLEADAARQAADKHSRLLDQARDTVIRLGTQADQLVDGLLGIQHQLNANADDKAQFLSATFRADLASARRDLLNQSLGDAERQIQQLTNLRQTRQPCAMVTLLTCSARVKPAPAARRWGLPGLGAVAALLLVLFGQVCSLPRP